MAISALSTAGFARYVTLASDVGASQQAWQSLAQSLANSNLAAAQTAFNTYQQINKDLAAPDNNSQSSKDMAALVQAIGSGNVSDAQQAFATLQNDRKGAPPLAVQNAERAVTQTVNSIDELLGLSGSSRTAASVDPATALLDSAYGLTAPQTTADPELALLEAKYGSGSSGDSSSSDSAYSTATGSAASVDIYA